MFIDLTDDQLEGYTERVLQMVKVNVSKNLRVNIDDYMKFYLILEHDEPARWKVNYKLSFKVKKNIGHLDYHHNLTEGYLAEYIAADMIAERFLREFSKYAFKAIEYYEKAYYPSI